ncbi:hypothetical protein LJR098_003027 [Rhizobium sp. LjRoot98]|uniref:hypothetical protein n=1 Tax=unclassified Rhizobium TaxID=2613769 RepID=UPI000A7F6496|nr:MULTISPECIES: hypothetical protein [unclassified Rhizobium]
MAPSLPELRLPYFPAITAANALFLLSPARYGLSTIALPSFFIVRDVAFEKSFWNQQS